MSVFDPSGNSVPALKGVSNVNGISTVDIWANPTTHALLVEAEVTIDPGSLATAANQTDGSQKTQIVDAGGEAVTVTGGKLDVNASIDTTGLATSAKQDEIIADTNAIETAVESIDTKTPALGQALAAASVPVVLTAAQVSTLTPQTNALTDTQLRATPVSIANNSINGPGAPTIDSYTSVGIVAVTGADQVLIAAPGANKQIWVYGIGFSCSVAGTVAIQDEDNTVETGVMNFAQYGGLAVQPAGNFAMPLWKAATNKALEADVTTATINGWICYAIVSV